MMVRTFIMVANRKRANIIYRGRADGRMDGRTDGRTDATKYIISLASRSIKIFRPPPSPLSLHCKDRRFLLGFDSIPKGQSIFFVIIFIISGLKERDNIITVVHHCFRPYVFIFPPECFSQMYWCISLCITMYHDRSKITVFPLALHDRSWYITIYPDTSRYILAQPISDTLTDLRGVANSLKMGGNPPIGRPNQCLDMPSLVRIWERQTLSRLLPLCKCNP